MGMPRRGRSGGGFRLGAHRSGQLLVAQLRCGRGRGQAQLFPQPVEHLVQRDAAEAQGGQQLFRVHQVAAARHLGHRLAIQQRIEALTSQLPLQH
jgi:hypothetical protein